MSRLSRLFGDNAEMVSDVDFQLLLLANGIGALGTSLMSPLLDTLTGPFGVSAARIGLVVTAFAAPSIVLIPISGVLTDRFGRKPVLATGLALYGIGGMAIAFTTDFRVLLALRVLQGVGSAGLIPVIITSLGDLYEGDAEATAQGIRFSSSGVSQAIFPLIAGLTVLVAWQFPFFIYGLSLPVALAVLLWFEEPVTRAKPESSSDPKRAYLIRLAALTRRHRALAYLFARATVVLPFIAFFTYNSVVVDQLHGATPGHAGLLVTLYSVVYAVVATQTGRVSSRFDSPTAPLAASNLLLGGGLALFAAVSSFLLAAPAVLMMGAGTGLGFALYRSVITGLAPARLRGGLVSLAEGASRAVTTVTPLLIGGALVVLSARVAEDTALRWTIVGTGTLSALFGTASLIVAHYAPPVPHNRPADEDE